MKQVYKMVDYELDLAVKDFFELLNISISLADRYEKDQTDLREKYGIFVQLCEKGLPTRADLETWQSQIYSPAKIPKNLENLDNLIEKIASIPKQAGEAQTVESKAREVKETSERITLDKLLELSGSYFEEAGEHLLD